MQFGAVVNIYMAEKLVMKMNEIAFYLLKSINYQLDDRRHVADCALKVFQQSFDHVDT